MAKIGLNNFRYAIATIASDGTITYGGAKKPAKAISFNFTPNKSDASLYADDFLAESDTQVTGGTCTMGIDRLDDITMADLLGHSVSNGEVISSTNDVAPYVGLGRVVRLMQDGQQKFRATFFAKVKFSEPNEDNNTKGESVSFETYQIEGAVAIPDDGVWRRSEIFNTQAEAIAYLEGLMNATATAATVTYNVNGGTGSIAAVSTFVGQIIMLDDGSGLTPPSNKVFAGWDTSSSATHADITNPYVVTGDVTLYAVWVAAE